MQPLLALTIDNSSIFFWMGALALIAVILTGITTNVGKAIAVAAVICLGVAFWMKNNTAVPIPPGPYYPPTPTPGPSPYPNPYPVPPAPMNFATGVADAFKQDGGTPDDAALVSAMFDQLATSLEYDGVQQQPRIQTANDLGSSFARLQQYRFASNPTPIANKFPRFESFIAAEMNKNGINAGPLDSTKRGNAVLMFRTVSGALRGVQ